MGRFAAWLFGSRKEKDVVDEDQVQDSGKPDKYVVMLRRELVVDRFMFDSASFDHRVEAAFMRMKRSEAVRQGAVEWFQQLQAEREKVWRKLLREKDINLSSAMPYLIKINQAEPAWRTMDEASRDAVYEWQRRVNFVILEMFILRHKALSFKQKMKNLLVRKKK